MKLVVQVVDLIHGRTALGDKGISVIEYVEVKACLRPNVVWFRRMDMRIVPAGRGQDAAVVRGISYLLADLDLAPIDHRNSGSVDQAVDEWGVGVLENLLDGTGKLVCRLRPVVVFHGDYENRFD